MSAPAEGAQPAPLQTAASQPERAPSPSTPSTPPFARGAALMAAAIVAGLGLAFGALPTWALDLLLAAHLGASIWLLARALDARDVAAFAPLPTWFLWGVLGRLALNVASTRLILAQGDAGALLAAFSGPLIGGSVAVGAGVLCALLAAQVVVITRGGERMAEVAARFSLDALPGQQLALDADQRGGALNPTQARAARARLLAESKLFGALDGTLKMVRGDAWLGLLILLIDLLGGVAVATLEGGLSGGDALRAYAALTVADGLVHLASGLVLSLGAGLMVLRMSTPAPSTADPSPPAARPLWVAAGALGALALLPSVPAWPLALVAAGAAASGLALHRRAAASAAEAAEAAARLPPADADGLALPPPISITWSGDPADADARDRVDARWRALGARAGLRLPPIAWVTGTTARATVRLDGMTVLEANLPDLAADALRPLLPHALSMQLTQDLLDRWRAREPQLVAAATAHALPLHRLTALLRRLLHDGVHLHAMRPLLEASLTCPPGASLDALYAAARLALGAELAELIRSASGCTLLIGPQICDTLARAHRPAPADHPAPHPARALALSPEVTQEILNTLSTALSDHDLHTQSDAWVCVVSALPARLPMQLLLRAQGLSCPVIALDEVAAFDSPPLLTDATPIDIGGPSTHTYR